MLSVTMAASLKIITVHAVRYDGRITAFTHLCFIKIFSSSMVMKLKVCHCLCVCVMCHVNLLYVMSCVICRESYRRRGVVVHKHVSWHYFVSCVTSGIAQTRWCWQK
eukprot:TRINITY_DN174_c1_g1_i8.p1 TRINITY_DN174_c1_g1~~TRINITY_DN174_c1_g1_i8.p1  ORF type:complete len:107 (+),score=9.22 TRINITY_DN174_c1_g1_i8:501-821(+)